MILHLQQHRLVLPIPCSVDALRAALAEMDGAARLVDVALAGEDGRPVTVDGLADVVLVACPPTPGGDTSPPVATPPAAPVATLALPGGLAGFPGSGRRELGRLLAEVPASDPRSVRQLAADLGPEAGLAVSTARRYMCGLRGDR